MEGADPEGGRKPLKIQEKKKKKMENSKKISKNRHIFRVKRSKIR